MKKQLELFAILLTITFSTLTFACKPLFPVANAATYVEESITQDTVWTLVDSPFVVSKNVTVYPDVTLTIEPEVEVKFGGEFALIVEGRLVANGTKDKMITFTSNKYEPEAGDWKTINFSGTQLSSLTYCIIEHGTNGIIVENGFLSIQNSLVGFNSGNGIKITDGDVEVKNNGIANNTLSGIRISDCNRVVIQNNTIGLNEDGITLAGSLTAEINIDQNTILLNRESGVLLEATAYDNTVILNNTLSENSYGFYVSTNTSTYITRNYILNNTVGIFYENGINHVAYFNDIYDNSLGMDVPPSAEVDEIVNAEHNYWGDESGPYHESLNPRGKGNPVGGDGVNLDFIFFLTTPIDYNNMPPTAILWTDKILVAPNQNVTFIGTDSYDDGRVDQYFFNFGDGANSSWTTLSLLSHNYSSTGTYSAKLTVMDDFGDKSDSSIVVINVQDLLPLETSVTLSDYTVNYNEQIVVTAYVSNGTSAVENATVTLFSVKGGSFTPTSGLTNSTGYFTTTFAAPNVTEITNVRIIASSSKTGYGDGSDYEYLKVFPPLTVQVTAEPATIKSEETTTVTVYVTIGFEQSVADALLVLSSDYGSLSETMGVTDADGSATFVFTAPQTTAILNATIVITATKSGYMNGEGQTAITIVPKVLAVQITAEPDVTISEAKIDVTIYVTYAMIPISNANATIASENGGHFSATTGLTDQYGYVTFIFTAPQVNTLVNITLIAQASKAEYADGENRLNITVSPGVLSVEVEADPSTIMSRETTVVTVHAKCNATPVSNISVVMFSSGGNFSIVNTTTDERGCCTFLFNAPRTTAQLPIIITANATKNGYISGENQTTITVMPETTTESEGGWPITTILLILIPIVIAVIVVVLIKLKIITFSSEEEES